MTFLHTFFRVLRKEKRRMVALWKMVLEHTLLIILLIFQFKCLKRDW
jgi:hypothetical protein